MIFVTLRFRESEITEALLIYKSAFCIKTVLCNIGY